MTLASNKQLYVLNRAGRLMVTPNFTPTNPITATQADRAIKISIEEDQQAANREVSDLRSHSRS